MIMREHAHTGQAALAAMDYMARHDYELDEQAHPGVRASTDGEAGRVVVEIDDGELAVFVVDVHGVGLWSASASALAPKGLVLDMIELAEMSAKVSYGLRVDGKPTKKPCRRLSIGCVDGQAWHGEPVNVRPDDGAPSRREARQALDFLARRDAGERPATS